MADQSVTIIGPNLRDQSKGDFHVHAFDCSDIARNAKRDSAFKNGWTIIASSRDEITTELYSDFNIEEGELEMYKSTIHFAPCVHLK